MPASEVSPVNLYIVLLTCLGLLTLAVAWLPALLRQLPLSLPIICVAFGFALFSAPGIGGEPDLLAHPHLTERMTELIVIVALMGAGLLGGCWRSPCRCRSPASPCSDGGASAWHRRRPC
jgi:hypothetical protein